MNISSEWESEKNNCNLINTFMRLQKFINEDIPYDEPLFKLIDRRASKFVREMKSWGEMPKSKSFLFRGTKKNIEKWEILKSHLEERSPVAMTLLDQYVLNEGFKKKFGWPARFGVFATSNVDSTVGAGIFGDTYIFIPLDDYEYVWSPKIKDINIDMNDISKPDPYLISIENAIEEAFDELNLHDGVDEKQKQKIFQMVEKTVMRAVNTYTDSNLKKAVEMGSEVSFKCGEYLLISKRYSRPLAKRYL